MTKSISTAGTGVAPQGAKLFGQDSSGNAGFIEADWLTTWINAKGFGAKGDGVTDDLSAIQSAIDAAIASGINKIWFPSGTYLVSADPTNYGEVYLFTDEGAFSGNSDNFDFSEKIETFTTTAAASGSTGGSGGNRSWRKVLAGNPAMLVFKRLDPSSPVFGRLYMAHDAFNISAEDGYAVNIGTNVDDTDEGMFIGLSVKKDQIIANPASRDVDIFFYTSVDTQSMFIDGGTGEVRFRGPNGTMTIMGTGVDSKARIWMQNDAHSWSVQCATDDRFKINDESGNGSVFLIATGCPAGAFTMNADGSIYLQGLPTEKLKIVDAVSTGGTTGNGYITVTVGAATRYIQLSGTP